MRLDLALAGLRLFKSRTQAQAAIAAGSVLLNGRAAKASDTVRPGDHLRLTHAHGARTLELLALPSRSLTRARAHELVREIEG